MKGHISARTARVAASVPALLLGTLSCMTPAQSRSLQRQVLDIRRQVDLVQAQQQRSREAVEEWQEAEQVHPAGQPAARTDDAAGTSTTGGPELRVAAPEGAAPADSQALYRKGYALYHQGDFAGSAEALQSFLQVAPSSPQADNAQYWIGETLYARGMYRQAIEAFRMVTERYPDGDKAPHALYKIALCHEKLGETERARFALQTVVRAFPDSDVASMARRRLERP
jgi:tol-pal system protein YbgF